MPQKKTLDAIRYGPVIDTEGMMDTCFNNLERLLIEIFTNDSNAKKTTRYAVLKSSVRFDDERPYRVERTVIKTISWLLSEYAGWNCSRGSFDLERAKSHCDMLEYSLKKQGDRNSAFGPYIYVTRVHAAMDEAKSIHEKTKDIYETKKELERRGIGGILQPFL